MSPVIDVHTHMLTEEWFALLSSTAVRATRCRRCAGGLRAIHLDGAPFMTPVPAMFDWDCALKTMDERGVDIGVVSLTCPNVLSGAARRSASRPRAS